MSRLNDYDRGRAAERALWAPFVRSLCDALDKACEAEGYHTPAIVEQAREVLQTTIGAELTGEDVTLTQLELLRDLHAWVLSLPRDIEVNVTDTEAPAQVFDTLAPAPNIVLLNGNRPQPKLQRVDKLVARVIRYTIEGGYQAGPEPTFAEICANQHPGYVAIANGEEKFVPNGVGFVCEGKTELVAAQAGGKVIRSVPA